MAAHKPVPEKPLGLYTAHFFIKLVRECEILGISAQRLLHGTGIEQARLHDAATRVTLKQTMRLADNALRLCERPDLGLYLGTKTQTNDGGLVSVAAVASGNFWEKAQLNERYHRIINACAPRRTRWLLRLLERSVPADYYEFAGGWNAQAVDHHQAILDAIVTRDREAARRAMEHHLHESGVAAATALRKQGFWD